MAAHANHAVQFYDDDTFLADAVAEYVDAGLKRGRPALVIATQQHRDGIIASLVARGHDVGALVHAGSLTLRDARETLGTFLAEDGPDPELFHREITGVLREARGTSPSLRVFGEMVDLLWRDGEAAAVARLECLWNELMAAERIELLCAYDMAEFADASHAEAFATICRAHHHVRPTESYARASDASRLVEITSLQQRAKALETELRQRALLEQRLREALEQRERLLGEERAARAEAERARIVAQDANRAKDTFLAVMSHELRTPLNAIGGYAELIGMEVFGPVSEGQRGALERLQASQRHLLGLIDQVLGFADTESGTARYEIVEVPVAEILTSVEATMLARLQAGGLIYTRGADPAPFVRADPARVRQILLQLVSNAMKFTAPGGRVTIDTVATERCVLIQVRDTGTGIPPRELGSIFEPFLQGEAALTRTRGGIGLGLALSRDHARAMHGDLTAESVVGEGSTFTLTLPRAVGSE